MVNLTNGLGRRIRNESRLFLRFIEENGIALRNRAGLSPRERLDPFAAADQFGVVVVNLQDLQMLGAAEMQELAGIDARTWSGGAIALPNGKLLLVLNPNQTQERATVTVMEEVAHAHYGHKPIALTIESTGMPGRTYDPSTEKEAYWTAAAALLPSSVVARAIWQGIPIKTLALTYGVSTELVEFRIKTLQLWPWRREKLEAA